MNGPVLTDADLWLYQSSRGGSPTPEQRQAQKKMAVVVASFVKFFARAMSRQDREDIGQEVLMKLVRYPGFRGGNATAYVRESVRNAWLTVIKRRKTQDRLYDNDAEVDDATTPARSTPAVSSYTTDESSGETPIRRLEIEEAIANIDEPDRTYVRLLMEGWRYNEIAEHTFPDDPKNVDHHAKAIKQRLYRLKLAIRDKREKDLAADTRISKGALSLIA